MKQTKFPIGLDIGTTKVVAMIGKKSEHNKMQILGIGLTESLGIRRGVVNNINHTVESIKNAVQQAQLDASCPCQPDSVIVGVAGEHIRSVSHSDYLIRTDPTKVISEEEVAKLTKQARLLSVSADEEIIHVIPQEYKIDQETDIKNPVGMCGARIEGNFHIVLGKIASIKNIGRCVSSAGLTMKGITLEPVASSTSVLDEEEKEAGVALIDMGGGTTDLAIFKNNAICHTTVIPFGGNTITDDIKECFKISRKQAEQIKILFGSAISKPENKNELVSVAGVKGRPPKEIEVCILVEVIAARVKEIIEYVYKEIEDFGYTNENKSLIGIVLTGGGSQLNHIKQLVEYITGLETRIGSPSEQISAASKKRVNNPQFATVAGLLIESIAKFEDTEHQQEDANDQEVQQVKPEGKLSLIDSLTKKFKKIIDMSNTSL